jgi:pyridoxamine 5'-phosphate oxidase
MVLLRGFSEQGFEFHTNYQSRKGDEIAQNPQAALVFFWADLEKQIRIEGSVEKLTGAESDAYFQKRPLGHRISALASPQSQVISGRVSLEKRMAELAEKYAETLEVPRPSWWGGYRVIPHTVEFWQGGPNRLHDRLRYKRQDGGWKIERLAP